jgi:hypothetical protein
VKSKDIIKMISQFENLKIDRIERKSHIKVFITSPKGKQLLVVSMSASDRRAELNNRSILKRWNQKEK